MTQAGCIYSNKTTIRLNAARALPGKTLPDTQTAKTSEQDKKFNGGIHGHTFVVTINFGSQETIDNVLNYPESPDAISDLQSQLDHSLLNDIIDHPSDVNIVNYIYDKLNSLDIQSVVLTSAYDRGVYRDRHNLSAWQTYQFESAHKLPNVPEYHKCGRMHGHSFFTTLYTPLKTSDESMDTDLLDNAWQPIKEKVNFKCLNNIEGLENPTSENLAAWIWHCINNSGTTISRVEVLETPTSGCSYTGNQHTAWKDFSLDCALNAGSGMDTLFGHTFHVRDCVAHRVDSSGCRTAGAL